MEYVVGTFFFFFLFFSFFFLVYVLLFVDLWVTHGVIQNGTNRSQWK